MCTQPRGTLSHTGILSTVLHWRRRREPPFASASPAATGLVLYFIGAVIAHLRARVLYNIAFPGAYLGLSAASLLLLAAK